MKEFVQKNKILVGGVVTVVVLLIVVILLIVSIPKSPSSTNNNNLATISSNPDITSQATTTAKPTSQASTSQIDLTWWGTFLSEKDVQPLVNKYQAAHSNVKITYRNQVIKTSDINSYKTKLDDVLATTANSSAPDIFMIDNGWSTAFKKRLATAPADKVSASAVGSDYYEFVSTDFVQDNKVYGLPLWVDTLAIIYNADLWQTEGLTVPDDDWNLFTSNQALKLTKKTDSEITQAGFSAGISSNTEFWDEALYLFILQNGVKLDSGGKAVFGDNSDSQVAIDFYKKFAQSGGTSQTWNSNFNQDVGAFLEKKLATYLAPSWRLNSLVKYNKLGKLDLEIKTAEVPQLKTTTASKSNIASYWANVINKNSSHSAAAWDFLAFLGQSENLELLNNTIKANDPDNIGIIYPRKDMKAKQIADKNLSVYVKSLDYAKSTIIGDDPTIKKTFQKILDSNTSAKETQTQVNSILSKY